MNTRHLQRVAARLGRRNGRLANVDEQGRKLELAPAPQVRLVKPDPHAELEAFLGRGAPRIGPAADASAAIEEQDWYHTIELPDGRTTNGYFDHRPLLPHYGLPADMSGMRALDVGTSDGFWAFEMERRGAEVVAVDLPRMSARDFPAIVQPLIRDSFDTPPGRRFEIAREALGSRVELVRLTAYEVDPGRLGTFDFVHVGDLLLHLRDQPRALAAVRSVTTGEAHIADAVQPEAGEPGRNLSEYHGGFGMTHWWTPSVQTLAQMTLDAGFDDVQVLGMYRLGMRGAPGPWRAILRARA
jgi:tRNA (mo5U34)-methyltransferase